MRRLDEEALHARAFGALKPEGLGRIHLQTGKQGRIVMSELARVRPVSGGGEDFGGRGHIAAPESEGTAIAAHADFGIVAGGRYRMRRAVRKVDDINGLFGLVFGDKIDAAAVRRPERFLHAAVEPFGKIGNLPCGAIVKHQPPAIALIPGDKLRVIGNGMPVG